MSTLLTIHNTLTGKKEKFTPLFPGEVKMYVCGITPYDECHLGHARCYVFFDVFRRYLEYSGYIVRFIQNFTDIDDKIIKKSNEMGVPPSEISEKYIQDFFQYRDKLNILPADFYPLATHFIPQIVRMTSSLIEKGYAYVVNGDVYFSVAKFPGYGKLSKRNPDELKAGARVEVDKNKKAPLDFALWKSAKPGEPSWDSPWGTGRPGWHIECSAMALDYLKTNTLDVHGGGQDLIFPHHENEIAQSEAITGKPFARYWVHNGFVTINKEKMSKSLGNFFSLKDILAKYDPIVVRLFLISQHYRTPLDFSDDRLEQAKSAWERVLRVKENTENLLGILPGGPLADAEKMQVDAIMSGFISSMDDDFNTAEAVASLHRIVNRLYLFEKDRPAGLNIAAPEYNLYKMAQMCDILGLKLPGAGRVEKDITDLVALREEARKKKRWRESDELRDKILKKGYLVEDTPYGPRVKKTE
ncbi:MAG: cysteine--tRNA ligase [Elusimicrobiota bacterium]